MSRQRVADRGLADRITFALEDYRATQGSFDRIVSVGMFEHVGVSAYAAYFQACRRLLKADGVMLLHTIGRTGRPYPTNPWVTRYIFPGGHLPTLSEITPAIERSGLVVTDIEVLRLHYAYTLKAWRERFIAHWEDAKRLYDERFCRMWECYLALSEAAFRFEDAVVFQVQLARRHDTVPLTRGYIAAREAALRGAEGLERARRVPRGTQRHPRCSVSIRVAEGLVWSAIVQSFATPPLRAPASGPWVHRGLRARPPVWR